MMKFIDLDNSWGEGILQDWYIHSVNPDDIPQWTDEHIEELCKDFYVIPKETTKYDIDCDLDRLKELAEADKGGRCLVLPCKPSDVTVYQLRNKKHALGIGVSPRRIYCTSVWADGDYALNHQGTDDCLKRDFNKTWFLTKEEAERALEERK